MRQPLENWSDLEQAFAKLGQQKWGLAKQLAVVLPLGLVVLGLICTVSVLYFRLHSLLGVLIVLCIVTSLGAIVLVRESTEPRSSRIVCVLNILEVVPEVVWASVFLFAFVCWWTAAIGNRIVSSHVRFPLAYAQGITVDNRGRIYCLSRVYNRLQVFDSEGSFLRGWFVDIPHSSYRVTTDASGEYVRVAIEKGGVNLFYDPNGGLVRKDIGTGTDFHYEFRTTRHPRARDVSGNSYEIRHSFLHPKIIKTTPDGEEIVLVSDPFGLWLATMPLPGFALLMGFPCILNILRKRRKRSIETRL